MKVVFLDFDGVLVNRKSFHVRSGLQATADPPCIEALNAITDATGAVIVVSSTWRIGCELIELKEILKKWGATAKVIGKTPHLLGGNGSQYQEKERGEQIQHWLDSYTRDRAEVESFVILDDDRDMGKLLPRLVRTEFEHGLTMEQAKMAIELLRGAPQAIPDAYGPL